MHLYELPQVMRGSGNLARIMLSAALGIVLLMALVMVWLFEILLVTARWLLTRRLMAWFIQKGTYQEHYILVENGRQAKQYLQDLAHDPYSGVVIDGYVS